MKANARTPCAQCQRLQAQVEALQAQVDALLAEVAALREQLAVARKDSSTSSKPPSSDIVKPKPPPRPDGAPRSIGGQPGHPKHERPPFPPNRSATSRNTPWTPAPVAAAVCDATGTAPRSCSRWTSRNHCWSSNNTPAPSIGAIAVPGATRLPCLCTSTRAV